MSAVLVAMEAQGWLARQGQSIWLKLTDKDSSSPSGEGPSAYQWDIRGFSQALAPVHPPPE